MDIVIVRRVGHKVCGLLTCFLPLQTRTPECAGAWFVCGVHFIEWWNTNIRVGIATDQGENVMGILYTV